MPSTVTAGRDGDHDRVGSQQLGALCDELLHPAAAELLCALGDQLDADRQLAGERAQRRQMHHDVALAVGGAAPVPASVALGQLERRRLPLRPARVQWRLHVVVAIQQDRRSAIWRRDLPVDRRMTVGRFLQARVAQPGVGELVDHQLRRLEALARRELARVGDRLTRDELGQVVVRSRHQRVDALSQFVD